MGRRPQIAQQREREPDVARLAGTEIEGNPTASGVRDGVDLRRPSA
jgi:hypothetical protein